MLTHIRSGSNRDNVTRATFDQCGKVSAPECERLAPFDQVLSLVVDAGDASLMPADVIDDRLHHVWRCKPTLRRMSWRTHDAIGLTPEVDASLEFSSPLDLLHPEKPPTPVPKMRSRSGRLGMELSYLALH